MVQTASLYIRWSSEAQSGRDSLRRQLEAGKRYAETNDLHLVETIIDEAASAYSGHHLTKGRLGEFLRRVDAGDIPVGHVLLVESFDRLNRQAPLDALAPFTAILNAGVKIVTLLDGQVFTRESLSTDGGLRLLMSLLVMVRAHEESATKSKRVRAAWARKRQNATTAKLTKACPGWLSLSPDRSHFDVLERRAEIVRAVFQETADGLGKATIAARLNRASVPAFRGHDGWHPSYIHKLLWSDAPLGIYQPHILQGGRRVPSGPPIHSYYPTIIDAATVEAARVAAISRRTGAAGPKGPTYSNLFTGLACCELCGSSMVFVRKDVGEQYLVCAAARRGRRCGGGRLLNYSTIERWVLIQLAKHPLSTFHRDRAEKLVVEHREAEAKLEAAKVRLKALLCQFGADSTPEIVAAIADAREARATAASSLRAKEEELSSSRVGQLIAAGSAFASAERATCMLHQAFEERARTAQALRTLEVSLTCNPTQRTVLLSVTNRPLALLTL